MMAIEFSHTDFTSDSSLTNRKPENYMFDNELCFTDIGYKPFLAVKFHHNFASVTAGTVL